MTHEEKKRTENVESDRQIDQNPPVDTANGVVPQDIIDDYVETFGGAYYGSIFGGYDPDTPTVHISLAGNSPVKEGKYTCIKASLTAAPDDHENVEFCVGFTKNQSDLDMGEDGRPKLAIYGTDYQVDGVYLEYENVDGEQTWSDPVGSVSGACSTSRYATYRTKIPAGANEVYLKIKAIRDNNEEGPEAFKAIIYDVHTSGYEKNNTAVSVTIEDTPPATLYIELVGESPVEEGEYTCFKVYVTDPPDNHGDIDFCLGFSKSLPIYISGADERATYNVDYTVTGGYRIYDAQNKTWADIVTNPTGKCICPSTNAELYYARIPAGTDTVYFKVYAKPDSLQEKAERFSVMINYVHTAGYEKMYGSISITIDNNNSTSWQITRNKQTHAVAESRANVTISQLAYIIGLKASEFEQWLTHTQEIYTLANGQTISASQLTAEHKLAPYQQVKIPNIIFCSYFGDEGSHLNWEERKGELRDILGFRACSH